MAGDIFTQFLTANAETESPAVYYRWSLLSTIGAMLGRNVHIRHGHSHIYPNLYCMLIGTAGTRKSTPIKLCKKLSRLAGYTTIAADKTSKEKFLVDLEGSEESANGNSVDNILDQNIFGTGDSNGIPREMFIMADEANDFFGHGNIEFLSLLGNLWDFEGNFTYRIKTGKSLFIPEPTISILSANTPTGFALGFPSEILGQGFFSRLIVIHGENTGRRIPFPQGLDDDTITYFVRYLQQIRAQTLGNVALGQDAKSVLAKIYQTFAHIGDPRFESYSTRRFSQLLKLALIYCASRFGTEISHSDVIAANTVLSHAERYMPKALGEFGKSKNSDVSNKIVSLIENNTDEGRATSFKEILKALHQDIEKASDLSLLVQKLCAADKIQAVEGGLGFLAKRRVIEQVDSSLLDPSILTEEEKGMTI
jgi:hypothetical protein